MFVGGGGIIQALLQVPAPTAIWDAAFKGSDITLSGAPLLIATKNGASGVSREIALANRGAIAGNKYCEFTLTAFTSGANVALGISSHSQDLGGPVDDQYVGDGVASCGYVLSSGNVLANTGTIGTANTSVQGNVICMAVNMNSSNIYFRVNGGNWNANPSADPATDTGGFSFSGILLPGTYYPACSVFFNNDKITANFGSNVYTQTVPSSFGNW